MTISQTIITAQEYANRGHVEAACKIIRKRMAIAKRGKDQMRLDMARLLNPCFVSVNQTVRPLTSMSDTSKRSFSAAAKRLAAYGVENLKLWRAGAVMVARPMR